MLCANSGNTITAMSAVCRHAITINNRITVTKALNINRLGDRAHNCRTLEVRIMDGIMSNLRNKCKGHRLINRPPMSPYLYNYWWRNKPLTTIQEVKPKKEGVYSEAEASPPPQSLTYLNPSIYTLK